MRILRKRKPAVTRRYFGIVDLSFHGGAFAPDEASLILNVELIDASGEAVMSAKADRASLKPGIPDGHGFCLPVPYEWLTDPVVDTEFQFRIVETGEVFPKVPRVLSASKMLRKIDRLAASKYALQQRVEEAAAQLSSIAGDDLLVVGIHEMSRTGAPMIALEIIKRLRLDRGCEIVLLCKDGAGVLEDEFREHCALVVTDLDRASKVAEQVVSDFFAKLGEMVAGRPVLVNSICSTRLVELCETAGMPVVSLVHEYPHAFESEWVRQHLDSASRVVFPCQHVRQSFVEEGLLADRTPVSIIPQGCYLLEKPPLEEAEAERFAQQLVAENHLSPDDRLVVACGTIDARKGFDWFVALIREYGLASPFAATTHFIWIGRVGEKTVFEHALHDLRQHGVIGHFHHVDEIGDVRVALRLADALLLCSRIDPFPSVVLESFAMGVPVIGFDKGQGCRELIADSGFGTVVSYQDFGETIGAIDELLSPDSEKAQRVKEGGAAFVAERFAYSDYVVKISELLFENDRA